MAEVNSTRGANPRKPYPDFPLGWHHAGYWCQRIRSKLHYFGPRWGTWSKALEEYQKVCDDLHVGRTPGEDADGVTVRHLCHHFLTDCQHGLSAGELSERSLRNYKFSAKRLVDEFGAIRQV